MSFYWKVSSESGSDYLKFYIDDNYQDQISGEKDWQKKSYSLSAGSRTLKWVYSKDSSGYEGDDRGWVDGLLVGTGKLYPTPDEKSEALDSNLKFTVSGDAAGWFIESGTQDDYYYDGDSLRSSETMSAGEETWLQAIVDSDSSETINFYWKISAESGYDYRPENGCILRHVAHKGKSEPLPLPPHGYGCPSETGIHRVLWESPE